MILKRPLPVVVIACLLIITGASSFAFHLPDLHTGNSFHSDIVWALLVNLLAIVAGVYLLRASNWARYLAVAWMLFHVGLSLFHPIAELAMHVFFLAAIAYFLFRPAANQYFRAAPGKTSAL